MQQPSNVSGAVQTAYWGKLMTLTATTNAYYSGKFFSEDKYAEIRKVNSFI